MVKTPRSKLSSNIKTLTNHELTQRQGNRDTYTRDLSIKGKSREEASSISDFLFEHKKSWNESKKMEVIDQFPIVKTFYDFLVPDELSEREFWERYSYRCDRTRIRAQLESLPASEIEKRVESISERKEEEKGRVYQLPKKKMSVKLMQQLSPKPKKIVSPRSAYDLNKLRKAAATTVGAGASPPPLVSSTKIQKVPQSAGTGTANDETDKHINPLFVNALKKKKKKTSTGKSQEEEKLAPLTLPLETETNSDSVKAVPSSEKVVSPPTETATTPETETVVATEQLPSKDTKPELETTHSAVNVQTPTEETKPTQSPPESTSMPLPLDPSSTKSNGLPGEDILQEQPEMTTTTTTSTTTKVSEVTPPEQNSPQNKYPQGKVIPMDGLPLDRNEPSAVDATPEQDNNQDKIVPVASSPLQSQEPAIEEFNTDSSNLDTTAMEASKLIPTTQNAVPMKEEEITEAPEPITGTTGQIRNVTTDRADLANTAGSDSVIISQDVLVQRLAERMMLSPHLLAKIESLLEQEQQVLHQNADQSQPPVENRSIQRPLSPSPAKEQQSPPTAMSPKAPPSKEDEESSVSLQNEPATTTEQSIPNGSSASIASFPSTEIPKVDATSAESNVSSERETSQQGEGLHPNDSNLHEMQLANTSTSTESLTLGVNAPVQEEFSSKVATPNLGTVSTPTPTSYLDGATVLSEAEKRLKEGPDSNMEDFRPNETFQLKMAPDQSVAPSGIFNEHDSKNYDNMAQEEQNPIVVNGSSQVPEAGINSNNELNCEIPSPSRDDNPKASQQDPKEVLARVSEVLFSPDTFKKTLKLGQSDVKSLVKAKLSELGVGLDSPIPRENESTEGKMSKEESARGSQTQLGEGPPSTPPLTDVMEDKHHGAGSADQKPNESIPSSTPTRPPEGNVVQQDKGKSKAPIFRDTPENLTTQGNDTRGGSDIPKGSIKTKRKKVKTEDRKHKRTKKKKDLKLKWNGESEGQETAVSLSDKVIDERADKSGVPATSDIDISVAGANAEMDSENIGDRAAKRKRLKKKKDLSLSLHGESEGQNIPISPIDNVLQEGEKKLDIPATSDIDTSAPGGYSEIGSEIANGNAQEGEKTRELEAHSHDEEVSHKQPLEGISAATECVQEQAATLSNEVTSSISPISPETPASVASQVNETYEESDIPQSSGTEEIEKTAEDRAAENKMVKGTDQSLTLYGESEGQDTTLYWSDKVLDEGERKSGISTASDIYTSAPGGNFEIGSENVSANSQKCESTPEVESQSCVEDDSHKQPLDEVSTPTEFVHAQSATLSNDTIGSIPPALPNTQVNVQVSVTAQANETNEEGSDTPHGSGITEDSAESKQVKEKFQCMLMHGETEYQDTLLSTSDKVLDEGESKSGITTSSDSDTSTAGSISEIGSENRATNSQMSEKTRDMAGPTHDEEISQKQPLEVGNVITKCIQIQPATLSNERGAAIPSIFPDTPTNVATQVKETHEGSDTPQSSGTEEKELTAEDRAANSRKVKEKDHSLTLHGEPEGQDTALSTTGKIFNEGELKSGITTASDTDTSASGGNSEIGSENVNNNSQNCGSSQGIKVHSHEKEDSHKQPLDVESVTCVQTQAATISNEYTGSIPPIVPGTPGNVLAQVDETLEGPDISQGSVTEEKNLTVEDVAANSRNVTENDHNLTLNGELEGQDTAISTTDNVLDEGERKSGTTTASDAVTSASDGNSEMGNENTAGNSDQGESTREVVGLSHDEAESQKQPVEVNNSTTNCIQSGTLINEATDTMPPNFPNTPVNVTAQVNETSEGSDIPEGSATEEKKLTVEDRAANSKKLKENDQNLTSNEETSQNTLISTTDKVLHERERKLDIPTTSDIDTSAPGRNSDISSEIANGNSQEGEKTRELEAHSHFEELSHKQPLEGISATTECIQAQPATISNEVTGSILPISGPPGNVVAQVNETYEGANTPQGSATEEKNLTVEDRAANSKKLKENDQNLTSNEEASQNTLISTTDKVLHEGERKLDIPTTSDIDTSTPGGNSYINSEIANCNSQEGEKTRELDAHSHDEEVSHKQPLEGISATTECIQAQPATISNEVTGSILPISGHPGNVVTQVDETHEDANTPQGSATEEKNLTVEDRVTESTQVNEIFSIISLHGKLSRDTPISTTDNVLDEGERKSGTTTASDAVTSASDGNSEMGNENTAGNSDQGESTREVVGLSHDEAESQKQPVEVNSSTTDCIQSGTLINEAIDTMPPNFPNTPVNVTAQVNETSEGSDIPEGSATEEKKLTVEDRAANSKKLKENDQNLTSNEETPRNTLISTTDKVLHEGERKLDIPTTSDIDTSAPGGNSDISSEIANGNSQEGEKTRELEAHSHVEEVSHKQPLEGISATTECIQAQPATISNEVTRSISPIPPETPASVTAQVNETYEGANTPQGSATEEKNLTVEDRVTESTQVNEIFSIISLHGKLSRNTPISTTGKVLNDRERKSGTTAASDAVTSASDGNSEMGNENTAGNSDQGESTREVVGLSHDEAESQKQPVEVNSSTTDCIQSGTLIDAATDTMPPNFPNTPVNVTAQVNETSEGSDIPEGSATEEKNLLAEDRAANSKKLKENDQNMTSNEEASQNTLISTTDKVLHEGERKLDIPTTSDIDTSAPGGNSDISSEIANGNSQEGEKTRGLEGHSNDQKEFPKQSLEIGSAAVQTKPATECNEISSSIPPILPDTPGSVPSQVEETHEGSDIPKGSGRTERKKLKTEDKAAKRKRPKKKKDQSLKLKGESSHNSPMSPVDKVLQEGERKLDIPSTRNVDTSIPGGNSEIDSENCKSQEGESTRKVEGYSHDEKDSHKQPLEETSTSTECVQTATISNEVTGSIPPILPHTQGSVISQVEETHEGSDIPKGSGRTERKKLKTEDKAAKRKRTKKSKDQGLTLNAESKDQDAAASGSDKVFDQGERNSGTPVKSDINTFAAGCNSEIGREKASVSSQKAESTREVEGNSHDQEESNKQSPEVVSAATECVQPEPATPSNEVSDTVTPNLSDLPGNASVQVIGTQLGSDIPRSSGRTERKKPKTEDGAAKRKRMKKKMDRSLTLNGESEGQDTPVSSINEVLVEGERKSGIATVGGLDTSAASDNTEIGNENATDISQKGESTREVVGHSHDQKEFHKQSLEMGSATVQTQPATECNEISGSIPPILPDTPGSVPSQVKEAHEGSTIPKGSGRTERKKLKTEDKASKRKKTKKSKDQSLRLKGESEGQNTVASTTEKAVDKGARNVAISTTRDIDTSAAGDISEIGSENASTNSQKGAREVVGRSNDKEESNKQSLDVVSATTESVHAQHETLPNEGNSTIQSTLPDLLANVTGQVNATREESAIPHGSGSVERKKSKAKDSAAKRKRVKE